MMGITPDQHREANRALAKAIAYKRVGNDAMAAEWAITLIDHLELTSILKPRRA